MVIRFGIIRIISLQKSVKMYNIDIEIAGRNYPLLVEKDEEVEILKLVSHLNIEILEMQSRYGAKLNKQDILAMLLLTYAKKNKELLKNSETEKIIEKIDHLYLTLEHNIIGL